MISERCVSGLEYLGSITSLLQRLRREHATHGVWEAADLQWWWRESRRTDSWPQPFWFDANNEPVAAAVATDWRGRIGLDVFVLGTLRPDLLETVWRQGLELVGERSPSSIEVMLDDEDSAMASLLTEAGFSPLKDKGRSAWMPADDRPPVSNAPEGYTLASRANAASSPHHFIARNGPQVAERLAQATLYRQDLDLTMLDESNAVAAYGLFWLDPTTDVGFVEPMGTDEVHRRRGLAKHILESGMDRLARAGATRIKINYEEGNDASSKLYLTSGFIPTMTTSLWVRG